MIENTLLDCGMPLFFEVADPEKLALVPPPNRLGEAVRVAVRSLSGMQKEALVASARTGAIWRLASDEGAYLAGLDEAPCPLSFFTTGMACSYMTETLALAKLRGVPIERIRLVVDNYYTMAGSAREGTMRGGAENVALTAQIASAAGEGTLTRLVVDATAAAPVSGLLRGSHESRFSLTHNGRELATGGSIPLAGLTAAGTFPDFAHAVPRSGPWSGLVRRGGTTPRAAHTVTLAGDSLAEQQSRRLHVRGVCTLRDDGVKEVEQHLYNPHGSIFRFLCDEAPVNGGQGRAPDAAAYISAGIAFCFMTQLGRYAHIMRKRLDTCRIVQDTQFSLGGASGGTGCAGTAAPVETRVCLDSDENDDFARTALRMGEQTCFLHALCRTDLKVKVSVSGYAEPLPAAAAAHA
jgi:hypothetical protein